MRRIRITESRLRGMIRESVRRALNEGGHLYGSCLFCVQSGSIFRCNNQKSKNYGYFVDTDTTCKYYLADNY